MIDAQAQARSRHTRREIVLALAAMGSWTSPALAEGEPARSFPSGPVRLVVPFPPGGGSDIQARQLAERLEHLWKKPVVVENVSGANGGVAAANVARSAPDGHAILFATHPMMAINPLLYRKLPYSPKDFRPVVQLVDTPLVLLVAADSPFRSVADVVMAAKQKPKALNFGSGGVGTTQHLTGELFQRKAGIALTLITYRGNAQTTTALISKDIQMYFDGVPSALAQIRGGRVRGLGVTSPRRLGVLPELPTVGETLPGFSSTLAYGLLVPAATPGTVVAALNKDVNAVLAEPGFANRLASEGTNIDGGSPEQFANFLRRERESWSSLLRQLDLKLD